MGLCTVHRPPPTSPARGGQRRQHSSAPYTSPSSLCCTSPGQPYTHGDKLRPIAQQAQQLGFLVPSWVATIADATTMALLRFGLNEHARCTMRTPPNVTSLTSFRSTPPLHSIHLFRDFRAQLCVAGSKFNGASGRRYIQPAIHTLRISWDPGKVCMFCLLI